MGQGVTLTALVTVNAPGGGTPTGTVIFNNTVNNIPTPLAGCSAGVQLNPAPVKLGQPVHRPVTPTSIPQGSLQLTAVYSGDSNYTGSTSPIITQIVNKPVTTITMSTSNNPILYGTPVTFSATVAPLPPGTGTPSGTCTWFDGVTVLGTSTLIGGVCTYNAPLLAVGGHSISTQYGGDANYQGVIGDTLTEVVNKLPSAISLTSNSVNSVASQVVTFTAQISPFPPAGVPFATGQVAFMDGSTQIGVGSLSSGLATVSTASLSFGVHYISAVYIGDQNWAGATSAFVPQNVTLAQTSTQLSSSANPSVWGQAVTYTIATGVAFPGTVPAAGQVQLFDNTVALGAPVNIANGSVSSTYPA